MKRLFFIVLLLLMSCSSGSTVVKKEVVEPAVCVQPQYSPEVKKLAAKVASLKDKYYLAYADDADLLDTCDKIVKYCRYDKVFDKYDVAAIIIRESKFNHKAYNKRENVRGLMQITKPKIYWKDELFWYNDPVCKDQNIVAGLIVLNTFYDGYKTKKLAIKHYNGSSKAAQKYMIAVMAIKQELRSAKI